MPVGVAGLWEEGWTTPDVEYDVWRFMLREFHVDRWYMAPVVLDGDQGTASILAQVVALDRVAAGWRADGATVVWVDEHGDEPLEGFAHPDHVLYVTGRHGYSPMPRPTPPGDRSVRIVTPRNSGGLWAHQAVSCVLYDREVKTWR